MVVPGGRAQPAPVAAAGFSHGTGPCSFHEPLCPNAVFLLCRIQRPACPDVEGRANTTAHLPARLARGNFKPPKLHWDPTPWAAERRQAWPSPSSPSTLRSCFPGPAHGAAQSPSPGSPHGEMHVVTAPLHQTRGFSGRRTSRRSCSGLDSVPNAHLTKQQLPRLGRM